MPSPLRFALSNHSDFLGENCWPRGGRWFVCLQAFTNTLTCTLPSHSARLIETKLGGLWCWLWDNLSSDIGCWEESQLQRQSSRGDLENHKPKARVREKDRHKERREIKEDAHGNREKERKQKEQVKKQRAIPQVEKENERRLWITVRLSH